MINYSINNKVLLFFLRIVDRIFIPYDSLNKVDVDKNKSIKILLINCAHIGDVILSSKIVPIIKDQYPNSKIDFILGSWSKMVIENEEKINNIYVLDHWYYNRSNKSFIIKLYKYLMSSFTIYKKINKIKFDVAIDLNSHFPSLIPYLKLISIKNLVGYSTAGFGGLLTHRFNSIKKNDHELKIQLKLLKFLSINNNQELFNNKNYINNISNKEHFNSTLMNELKLKNYIIIHIGTGSKKREWELNNWINLVDLLINNGQNLVFTGKGERERKQIEKIINNQCINLCDKLNWPELNTVVKNANIVVGVESMIGHLSSNLDTYSVNIYDNKKNINRWKPLGNKSIVITDSNGVNSISVNKVFDCIQKLIIKVS